MIHNKPRTGDALRRGSKMLDIRPLTSADIPAALRLSTQAGWNQIEADWRRLIDLWPNSCLAGCHEGRLVATGTLATYGKDLGWVGMILVDESCRGRGFGGAILDAVIVKGEELGVRCLGLDATDMGRPVYLKRGFVDAAGVTRWVRPAKAFGVEVRSPVTRSLSESLVARDRAAIGFDRVVLLRRLALESRAATLAFVSPGSQSSFGLVRAGRFAHAIGPLIAADETVAASVVAAILGEHADQAFLIDALDSQHAFAQRLAAFGFEPKRKLTRMVRGPLGAVNLTGDAIFAAAGFELG